MENPQGNIWLRYRYWLLLLACLGSRLLTTIFYIEDPDSLHFALAAIDFDISKFQPHFPGYPVFCFTLKGFTLLLGSFALAFSLIGGLSTFAIIYSSVEMAKAFFPKVNAIFIVLLLFFNPLLWLMANRYMPDIMGLAVMLLALHLYIRGRGNDTLWFQFVAGLLAGVRLSFLPFLLLPSLYALVAKEKRAWQLMAGIVGVLVWLIPFVWDTGVEALQASAQFQTEGHFYEWGGTVYEESSPTNRLLAMGESIWAHGLGAYWPGRGALPQLICLGFVIGLFFFLFNLKKLHGGKGAWLVLASLALYLLWVLLFQNIIYKPRHILPVLPFILMAVAIGYTHIFSRFKVWGLLVFGVLLLSTAGLSVILVQQHMQASAIAQAKQFLDGVDKKGGTLISIGLVNEYMRKQGLKLQYLDIETDKELIAETMASGKPYYVIGEYDFIIGKPKANHAFYHNPYINKMWPVIVVSEFGGQ